MSHLRIVYAAGPGNIIGTFQHWQQGRDDPSQVSVTYSGQFYDACRDLGAEGYAIASCPTPGRLREGNFILVHRTIPFQDGRGPLYHLGQLWSGFRLLLSALRFRAQAAVVCSGTAHWFSLAPLALFGIKVIPSLHCVLWPKKKLLGRGARIIRWLDGWFFARISSTLLSASQDITKQIEQMTGGRHAPVVEFLPTYRHSEFDDCGPPPSVRQPFRVLYAGRIERDKGVFDLLAIARRFAAASRSEIVFDICGTGSALEELRHQSAAENLGERFHCHGHCSKSVMREKFAQCHVVIVPTTSDFIEGFNQVVAEGILSGRPVITSDVCPALDYVRDGVVEVPVDDVQAYGDAILQLFEDTALYEAKSQACRMLQSQFYDVERGWGAAMKRALASLSNPSQGPATDLARPGARKL